MRHVQAEKQNDNGEAPEKRACHRRRVLKTGEIRFNNGYASFGCQVRNMHEHGVMVEMGETTGIPHQFDLDIDGVGSVSARMIWRTYNRIGIEFSR